VRRPTVKAGSAMSWRGCGCAATARAALALVSTTAPNAGRERERDRLGAQQRRQHDGVAARAQRLRGALAVGLRPGDEQAHGLTPARRNRRRRGA
jgi:hypothetical protein